jgi:hypothetical protein
MALVEPARDVRLDHQPEPTQGDGHDGQAGQSVSVEIAEHEDAFRPLTCEMEPVKEHLGVR